MKKSRHFARHLALQAIYQWQISAGPVDQIKQQFLDDHQMDQECIDYFSDLLFGVATHQPDIDLKMADFVDRSVDQIDPVELSILRLGFYELIHRPDIPYRVTLNEWINLAKEFGAPRSHAYINGVLDKACNKFRPVEVKAQKMPKHPVS